MSLVTNQLSNLQLNAVAGTTYQISADANGGGQIGQIQLTRVAGFPSNDYFANRISLSSTNLTVNASTVGATRELGEPVHGGFQGSNSFSVYLDPNRAWDGHFHGDGRRLQSYLGSIYRIHSWESFGRGGQLHMAMEYTRLEQLYGSTGNSFANCRRRGGSGGRPRRRDCPPRSLVCRTPPSNDNFANRTVISNT